MPGRSSDARRAQVSARKAAATERLLADLPDMELVGILQGASNYTFLARLAPHPPGGLNVVYKPARGESPLWDFPAGTLYQREVAAYELSKILGWPPIPPTVVRPQAPHGVGAVQLFVSADGRHYLSERETQRDTWLRVALFDIITNNADRKSGHCLFDAAGHIWVIDHGLTFHSDPKLRTVIWDFSGEPMPGDLCGDVERTLSWLEGGRPRAALEKLLSPQELRTLKHRLRAVLEPRWRFPEPTSPWSVPWPLV